MSLKKMSILIGALLILAAILVACSPKTTPTAVAEETVPLDSVPFYALWSGSAHADAEAEAFNHWNEDDPAVVPVECARCHTPAGYLDYVGADSSPAGTVEAEVAVPGGVINCTTCHNDATRNLTSVTFPSGVTITGLGPEARCMVCHQGRASKLTVDEAIAGMEADTVSADLGFANIHYFAAAATLYGSEAHGGYEYEGMAYDVKHDHVTGVDTCVACHDSHTLQVKLETCQFCHQEVTSVEDLRDVREPSSAVDYDGDGNVTEGMYYEIEGLQQALYASIQSYANEISGAAIIYSADAYPYFIADANANGIID
ncbi:MAG: polyheme membrane-associated cytochrome C, partial [Chloroflexi bacterium]|nr:polyheme membrane-associated cytochrome C [Chloroflexota bacterium]